MAFSLCIVSDLESQSLAEKWAAKLALNINPPLPTDYTHQLVFAQQSVHLLDQQGRRLRIDFAQNHLDYQRKHRGKNELIAKALGLQKGVRRVLDLSVGMAIDSVFLCQLGFEVIGVERSTALYCLLAEAFAQTQKPELKSYQLFYGDSLQFLKEQRQQIQVDAIYFDPMYPHNKKKTALPKQEMVVFREIVGHDEDAAQVLEEALLWPVQRLVVKRPLSAEPLLKKPNHSFEGKMVRFDLYMGNLK